ncbi:MAG: hypothetical protein FJ100_16090 [Deltaproteobacteria bacterium]|nr:hypothetical protein [Deltaproteobacteria bacterium]
MADAPGSDGGSGDVAVQDALAAEAQADSAAAPGADAWCSTFASALCESAKACCKGLPPANCSTVWQKACAKAGFADLDDALIGGKVTLADADKSACLQALHASASACDKQAVGRALASCLRAWRDPATLGQSCAAPVDLACAVGNGRCSAKSADLYVCTQAALSGQACSATVPCALGLECLDGTLTRAKTCGTPGSTCNLGDKCWDGHACDNGACKKQELVAPASCADDAACPGTHSCSAGACVSKLCL